MDSHRFDTLTRRLYALINRRTGLRVLLAAFGAGFLGLVTVGEAAACRKKGARCKGNRDCCARRCGKRKRCLCSKLGKRCRTASDCCGPEPCVNGTCRCVFNGEPCRQNEECCASPDLVCTRNSCDRQGVCCSDFGVICDPENGDCDCCYPLKCQDDQNCRCIFSSEETTCATDRDCCYPATCGASANRLNICCLPAGQRCVPGDNCCGAASACIDGTCKIVCAPEETPCPAADPTRCCQEGETCCTASPSPRCCPAGTTCTTEGCIPPCPQDTNACDFGAEVTCGQGPLFAGCKCYRIGEFSFCARATRCIACQDDPDCRGQGGHPAALCIPCPMCQPPDPPTMCVVPCIV